MASRPLLLLGFFFSAPFFGFDDFGLDSLGDSGAASGRASSAAVDGAPFSFDFDGIFLRFLIRSKPCGSPLELKDRFLGLFMSMVVGCGVA